MKSVKRNRRRPLKSASVFRECRTTGMATGFGSEVPRGSVSFRWAMKKLERRYLGFDGIDFGQLWLLFTAIRKGVLSIGSDSG